jgi:hypothetical protein
MLFFRSEETVLDWCAAHHHLVRPMVRLDQLWGLARAWYSNRLEATSRRPQPAEMREIFARVGLVGDFWDPESDAFG